MPDAADQWLTTRCTLVDINPVFPGSQGAEFAAALVAACVNCTMEVSLAELQALFVQSDETFVVRVTINGTRLAEVKVVP